MVCSDSQPPPHYGLANRDRTGKQWHAPKKAFRPVSGLTPYEKRAKERIAMSAVKAKEKEMKEEKEAERKVGHSAGDSGVEEG
jgi:hypothetical protein